MCTVNYKIVLLKKCYLYIYPPDSEGKVGGIIPKNLPQKLFVTLKVGSVVEWLKHWTDDQHGLGSKPICAILLCPWERHFTALSPAWWS